MVGAERTLARAPAPASRSVSPMAFGDRLPTGGRDGVGCRRRGRAGSTGRPLPGRGSLGRPSRESDPHRAHSRPEPRPRNARTCAAACVGTPSTWRNSPTPWPPTGSPTVTSVGPPAPTPTCWSPRRPPPTRTTRPCTGSPCRRCCPRDRPSTACARTGSSTKRSSPAPAQAHAALRHHRTDRHALRRHRLPGANRETAQVAGARRASWRSESPWRCGIGSGIIPV